MLDKMNALLQAIEFHQRAHLFLAAIEDEVNRCFLGVAARLVLLQVQLGHNRI